MNPKKQTKNLEIFCGPNGAGKTTLAEIVLKKRGKLSIINADIIAKGLNASYDSVTDIGSGKIMLGQINEQLNKGISFAFETTLSGRGWEKIIKRAKADGYKVTLYFVTLDNVEISLSRIKARVKLGGHNIPEKTVIRRFERSHKMFYNTYKDLVDTWFLFDNSKEKTKAVALGGSSSNLTIFSENLYKKFLDKVKDGRAGI